jgi:Na+/proline symporter
MSSVAVDEAAYVPEPLGGSVLAFVAILVACYLLFLLGVSIWSWRTNRGKAMDVDEHFTGGGNLGPIVLCCTLFATFFSGYTVVGIPNETYQHGFQSSKWPAMVLVVVHTHSLTITTAITITKYHCNTPVTPLTPR